MNRLVPCIIIATLIFAIVKKVSVYDCFVVGGKEAARLILSLLPFLASVFLLVEIFQASGLNDYVSKYLGYVLSVFGIPKELSELIVIRPLSGSGSLAVLENILSLYGADSYVGRCASVISGSSDTVFYVVAVYLSASNDKRAPKAILISLAASFCGVVAACLLCKFM